MLLNVWTKQDFKTAFTQLDENGRRRKNCAYSGYLTRECFTPLYIIKEIPLKMTINSITLCIPFQQGRTKNIAILAFLCLHNYTYFMKETHAFFR